MSDKVRFTVGIPTKTYTIFRTIACSKSFNRGWFQKAITEAMNDYIKKYEGD